MIIAGLQNLSLVDYPGNLAAVVFTQGCNFRCGYCQNPDLVVADGKFSCPEKRIIDYISHRKNMLEGIVITGGEPTIHGGLPKFIKRVKDLGIKVKLDTNASNPDQLESLFRGWLLDFVAVDIKTSFRKYPLVSGIRDIEKKITESIRLTMLSTTAYEFRTTCVPGIVDEKDLKAIGETVKGAKKYCLQQFRPFVTYDKKFQNVKPHPKSTIQRFKKILEDFVEEVEIRGI